MPASSFVCPRCSSPKVRRARTHGEWQRLVRRLTSLRRYACGGCGHRGWTTHPLEHDHGGGTKSDRTARGRQLESRDIRATHTQRLRVAMAVGFATLLGALAAWFLIGRSGG